MSKTNKNLGADLQPVYYNRVMSDNFEKLIMEEYNWLIEFVKKNSDLDFQTGFDPKQNKSWFSVYRGTSRILQITKREKAVKEKIDAAPAYKALAPYIFVKQRVDEKSFEVYLKAIRENPKFGRYYVDSNGKRNEGYYQTLVSRRYTFENKFDDDFVIFDKEFVLGFLDDEEKRAWNEVLIKIQKDSLKKLRSKTKNKLPKNIKLEYGEIDFMGLTWDGDLIIMELKKDVGNGLSPIQIAYYSLQFDKLMIDGMEDRLDIVIKDMIRQKRRMGLIKWPPKAKELPNGLSGCVRKYIIIGNDKGASSTIKKRFALAKEAINCSINVFTCDTDGTLRPSSQF